MSKSDVAESCPDCDGDTKRLITGCGIIFKGDDWASKNGRIASQMRAKRADLGVKQEALRRDTNIGGRLVPNVEGERTDSWSEAAKLAKDKGKDIAGYENMQAKVKADTKRIVSR